ncbi:MAG: elongation factor 4 [Elusimicrobia bacterium]|nr:elongation factor 4 [Elusimicrobiota bacterium]MBD3412067.1 elongation factor 4 [Elusimicrobiota bacterium]
MSKASDPGITNIRNFSIVAHIDHGKSTLADRLLELTHTINPRRMRDQLLDDMELEKERGITIKAKAVRMQHRTPDGGEYILNLIDTPGHVDFSYEVSRSLEACEGVLLVIDATQGVEAQTLSNAQLAQAANLKIIPVLNKIDVASADVNEVKRQIKDVLGIEDEPYAVSAKMGTGVPVLLNNMVNLLPAPKGSAAKPLTALIFDSYYDSFRGVIIYIRIFDGELKANSTVTFMSNGMTCEVSEVGYLRPHMERSSLLRAGEVGYMITGIRDIHLVHIGDTVTRTDSPAIRPLPGYHELKPFVFAGLYPIGQGDYGRLKTAIEKLHLSDSSFFYQPERSVALGFGFRCGFLGLLHMDIVKTRLEREFDLHLIATAPNVVYRIMDKHGHIQEIENPSHLPLPGEIEAIDEPVLEVVVFVPSEFVGGVMQLSQEKRGKFIGMKYITPVRVMLTYQIPLAEVIIDYYDRLKSVSRGYASLDYRPIGFRGADLVKVDILINGEPIDALSFVTHKNIAYDKSRKITEKLKELIPRQMFELPIQARVGNKIIARETIRALRKDVIAKCYGGDITRKKKLLQKQREGKKKMKQFGKVEVPQEAFLAILKID